MSLHDVIDQHISCGAEKRASRSAFPTRNESEREGYVPNVVYSCGPMIQGETVVLPYGCSDSSVRTATVDLSLLLERAHARLSLPRRQEPGLRLSRGVCSVTRFNAAPWSWSSAQARACRVVASSASSHRAAASERGIPLESSGAGSVSGGRRYRREFHQPRTVGEPADQCPTPIVRRPE